MKRGFRSSLMVVAVLLLPGPAAVAADGAEGESPDRLPPRVLARLGTDRLRMRGPISGVAFSPDGRSIAACAGYADTATNRIALFDVRTGREVRRFVEPGRGSNGLAGVAFSPDGAWILAGVQGGDVLLWDLAGDRLVLGFR